MHDMLRMDEFLHRLRHPGIMIAPVHTNEQWFPMVSKWQIILSINLCLLPQNVSHRHPRKPWSRGGGGVILHFQVPPHGCCWDTFYILLLVV